MKTKLLQFLIKRLGDSPPVTKALELVKKEVKRYRRLIFSGAVLIFIGAVMMLPLPIIMGKIIDIVIPKKNLTLLFGAVGLLFAINFASSTISYFQGLLFFKLNNKMIIDIRMKLFEKLNRMPLLLSKQYGTGYLMSRIKDDPPRLAALFGEQIIQLIKQFFVLMVSLVALFIIDWQLAAVSVVIIPFLLYTVLYFGKKIKKQSEVVFERVAVSSKSLQENIDMVELCKSFARETFNTRRYLSEIVKTYRSLVNLKVLESLNSVSTGFIGSILPLTILGFGGYRIIIGELSIGMLVAFMSMMGNVVGPASSLIGFNIEIQKLKVALARVGEVLVFPEEPEIVNPQVKGVNRLNIEGLMFSYDGIKPILKNLCLSAEKGQKIGIAGPSGSGKTSLVRILSGLYQYAGNIYVDGVNIGHHQMKTLRKNVAVVQQEPFLFNDTIFANVAFGKTGASVEDVKSALVRAHAWEFVAQLPGEMYATVGEKGSTLSVGQKQRLAIARALIKDADILILDEATSNIDNISAKMIAEAVTEIAKEKIVLIIAHNLQFVADCSNIIFLQQGCIVEQGTHEELMALEAQYAEQFNRFSSQVHVSQGN